MRPHKIHYAALRSEVIESRIDLPQGHPFSVLLVAGFQPPKGFVPIAGPHKFGPRSECSHATLPSIPRGPRAPAAERQRRTLPATGTRIRLGTEMYSILFTPE